MVMQQKAKFMTIMLLKLSELQKPTGKVLIILILRTIPSVWQMHGGHEETENPAW